MCVCVYIYIYTHTHIHTQSRKTENTSFRKVLLHNFNTTHIYITFYLFLKIYTNLHNVQSYTTKHAGSFTYVILFEL